MDRDSGALRRERGGGDAHKNEPRMNFKKKKEEVVVVVLVMNWQISTSSF